MCCNHIRHRHGKIMKILTSDSECRDETPVVSTCRHTKSKVSGLNSEKNFCAGVSRLRHRHEKIMKISTSDSECRDETPVVSTCRHTKSKVSGLNSEKKFCAGVSRSERLGWRWGQKYKNLNLGVLPAQFDFWAAPHVQASDYEFGEATRKKCFLCWRQPHRAAWLRLRTKIQKFQLLILSAGVKPQSYPHVGTLNPKFQDWTRKKKFVLASAAVSGLSAAEDKNPKFWTWEFCLLSSISGPLPMS